MRSLTLDDLLELDAYEGIRDAYRRAIIEHKRERRLSIGDRVTLVFEDRETVRWQVLEMARAERLREPALLQQELDVYNELLPAAGELSATLFIEITESSAIRPELDRLIGIDEHLSLRIGAGDAELAVPARFDAKQLEEDRISAVHYVRFPLGEAARDRFADPATPARLRLDHPNYAAEAPLSAALRASLIRDLDGEPPALLGVAAPAPGLGAAPPRAGRDVLLAEGERVRALRPARSRGPEHVVLEARRGETLEQADAALFAELGALARRFGAEITARHGRCRLEADLAGPLRWHLLGG
jgi:Protein of unknown function (DUF3501)